MELNDQFNQCSGRTCVPKIGGNVVVMTDFQKDQRFSAIQQIAAYWEALRGNRLMPTRSEIDPRGIEQSLEYAFVLERVAPGIARFRIAGSHLSDLMGMEVRGMPITSFFTPAGRDALNITLEEVFERPAVADIMLIGERGVGRPPLEARILLLPMKSDLGDVSRIFGCLVAKGEIGRHPRRFDIVSTNMRVLSNVSDGGAIEDYPELADTPVMGFAEPKARPLDRTVRRPAPHLRLVKGDN
jgi:hypothetical protein